MNCYNNPKHSGYIKDENFVQNLIKAKKGNDSIDVVDALLGIALAAAVLLVCWVSIIFLG